MTTFNNRFSFHDVFRCNLALVFCMRNVLFSWMYEYCDSHFNVNGSVSVLIASYILGVL